MDEKLISAIEALRTRFAGELKEFRGEATVYLTPETIAPAAAALRDEFGFAMLIDASASDYWPQLEPRFHVFYQLYNMESNLLLRLRVPLNGNAPHIPTVSDIWPVANWKEREMLDMFGITFDGHPDPRRILMPHEWVGHPLRKDYPLGYEEVQFTFNQENIDVRKPKPKD